MSSSTLNKNGQDEVQEVNLDIDIDDLRERLGVVALEQENALLRQTLNEYLAYVNVIDLAVQELLGEPIVTEKMQYNIRRGGKIEISRSRPPIPANLLQAAPERVGTGGKK
jgi:hypothetical protein